MVAEMILGGFPLRHVVSALADNDMGKSDSKSEITTIGKIARLTLKDRMVASFTGHLHYMNI